MAIGPRAKGPKDLGEQLVMNFEIFETGRSVGETVREDEKMLWMA